MNALVAYAAQEALPQPWAVSRAVPQRTADRLVWVSDEALRNKFHIMAEAGAGKSRFMGRILAWLLFLRQIPQIILDPTGGTIDNFLDKMIRLPREAQEELWPRVFYVDMSGKGGYVVPFPLYYRHSPHDSLFDVSQRFLEVIRRMDVHLQKAPILGLNALATLSTYVGILLAALGCQITEAPSLIRRPDLWKGRVEALLSSSPEVGPAIDFYREFIEWRADERTRYANTFLTKILPFVADPTARAMFGASEPGITWEDVVRGRQTVLLDFRNELNRDQRRFKLLWCFQSLMDYFKTRGYAGRNRPVGLIIDEVTQLLGFSSDEHSIMAEDIEELVSVIARNYGVYLTIAHQNLPQLNSVRVQRALMTMGIQMIGVQTDPQSARYLADYFHRYDPYAVKRQEPVWMGGFFGAYVVDHRPIEFTPEEQNLLNSHELMNLGQFQFLTRVPRREGELQAPLRHISIANFDSGIYPDHAMVSEARRRLTRRRGRPIVEILSQIAARQRGPDTSLFTPEAIEPGHAPTPSLWGE